MTKARENGASYVLSLLTGYMEPPVGKEMMEGLHYNPYFEGESFVVKIGEGQGVVGDYEFLIQF